MRRIAAIAGVAALCVLLAGPGARAAEKTHVAVDKQLYAVEAPADPYSGDGGNIHVGVTGTDPVSGQQHDYARSFVHVALEYLPKEAFVGSVDLTVHVTASGDSSTNTVYQTYNVNTDQVVMQACALTEQIPDKIDSSHPEPRYDCQHGSAAGVKVDATTYRFDLTPLVKVWAKAGNTGAAILPIGGTGKAWVISFEKGLSTSAVTYTLAPVPAPTTKEPSPVTHYYKVPVAIAKPYPLPTAPPAAAPPAPAPVPEPSVRTIAAARSTAWHWVLPACLAFALLLGMWAMRPALAERGPWKIRVFNDVRTHPRSFSVASVVTVWAVLFAMYSVVVAPPRITVGGTTPSGSSNQAGPNGTGPVAQGTGPRAQSSYKTVQQTGPGVQPGSEFTGPGTTRIIGNVPVFFPANGGPPAARLYTGQDDLLGIDYSTKQIQLCGHAALTFGPEFNIDKKDIDVFWDYLNKHGGLHGWKFKIDWFDDGYDPGKAVAAAEQCKALDPFMLLGGIGFDQIPNVRQWAESNKMLYLHHIVTTAGSEGLRYSFTSLPSEEQMGILAGNLAVRKFKGKNIGIIWRDSPNWQSGHDLFVKIVKDAGLTIVGDHKVTKNQGNYTQEVTELKNVEHADVVFAWENALYTTEIITQAQGQSYFPSWIIFPFNLELATLDKANGSFKQPLYGIAAWDAYDPGYYEGLFGTYTPLIKEFEAQYAEMDPQGTTNVNGNDLLFLGWEGFKGLLDLFDRCLPQCTRNRMAGLLLTYHHKLPSFCDSDFTRLDGHHGGWVGNYFEVFKDPRDGHAAWRPTERCVPVE